MSRMEKFCRNLGVRLFFCALFLAGAAICWIIPPPKVVLPLAEAKPDGGHGWVFALPELPLPLWQRAIYKIRPGDGAEHDVALLEDGQALPLANCLHQDIRDIGAGRYSHWDNALWFSTSRNDDPTRNGRVYEAEIRTRPKARVSVAAWCALLGVVCTWLIPRVRLGPWPETGWRGLKAEQIAQRVGDALPRQAWTLFTWLMLLGPIVFCAAAALYLAACGWALWNGYASFAGWPVRHIATMFPVYGLDASLAARLRDWAVMAWAALALCSLMRRPAAELTLRRLDWGYRRLGLPAVMALFLFHLGCAWAAPEQISDYGSALAGQVPFSDANAHYQLPVLFTLDGSFDPWIMRRPLSCAMRLGLGLLAGWNPQRVIVLQTLVLGLSAWLLGLAVLRRWGFCSAVAACAFVFLLSKEYVSSFLVETPGQIWVCLALVLCLDALYVKSRVSALCALAALTITLLLRMGAMFLLPAVLCWIVVRFWNGWRGAAAHACLGLALVGVCLGAAQAISAIYSREAGPQGANFAYTLAALSFGGRDWSAAVTRYKEQLAGKSEKEQARFLYAQAWENIRHEPKTLVVGLAARAEAFCREAPRVMRQAPGDTQGAFFWLLAALACWRLWRGEPRRRIFWLLVLAGITASAAVVYFDEGRRALLPGYLFLGVLLAGGLRLAPCAGEAAHGRCHQPALVFGGLLILVMCGAPALAWRFPPEAARFLRHSPPPSLERDEALVWGGNSMAGVLVVPDDVPLPTDVPAVSLASFVANIHKSGVEQYQPLVTPLPPDPPFAFIQSVRPGFALIAPPEMLRRADVLAWRVRYTDWHPPNSPYGWYWKRVVTAAPLGAAKTP